MGWKARTHACEQYITSPLSNKFNFNTVWQMPKRGENKVYGFQILSFYQSFSNDIMAVKGLTIQGLIAGVWHTCTYCKTPLVASNFAFLSVIFKWHHGSKRVNRPRFDCRGVAYMYILQSTVGGFITLQEVLSPLLPWETRLALQLIKPLVHQHIRI